MCLLLVAHRCCRGYRLVVAANRDEFHARATDAAAHWRDHPQIIGGRDREAGGTWLALDRRGRFATITNVAGSGAPAAPRSRGLIVTDFLLGDDPADTFTRELAKDGPGYQGFNVLACDGDRLAWYSNRSGGPRLLDEGIYTLSNAALDTAWPKSERLREGFAELFTDPPVGAVDSLLALLYDGHGPSARAAAAASVARDLDTLRSSIFIHGDTYGTRCSTVILVGDDNRVVFHERRYDAAARATGDTHLEFELAPGSA